MSTNAKTDMAGLGGSFTFPGTDLSVRRVGFGAMKLPGPNVFGPPKDRDLALAVLREAVASGVNHIDTADFYGPHVSNVLIREALSPYPDDLVIVTKLGGKRGDDGSWQSAHSREQLIAGTHDNLRNLGLETLEIVNLRARNDLNNTKAFAEQVSTLAELRQQGLIRHIGLSAVTSEQVDQARKIVPIVCVQNEYNIAQRKDDALIDELNRLRIAYVPFFPLGGFTRLQWTALNTTAGKLGATSSQVALAWLLHRSPNILLIPGTSSLAHLRENVRAGELALTPEMLEDLDHAGGSTE